jgi:hypothetical protein
MVPSNGTGKLNATNAKMIIDRWWGGRVADNIRVVRSMRNSSGAVFDIYEDQFERFMDNFDHIKGQEGDRLDFVIERCQELPELAEDDAGGQGWRNDGDNGGFD